MPTLIRIIVILLVLVGLAYGAMFALVAAVTPRDRQVTIRIPARELVPAPSRDPLVRREIDTSRKPEAPAAPAPASEDAPAAPQAADTPPPAAADGEVVTLQPGVE